MKYDRSKSDQLTQRRRDQIIEAAERSFRKRGFHATTLREIAAEFGMSVGHIYNYFSGKDAILEALIHRKIDDFLSLLTKGNPNDTVRDRLRRVVNSYIAIPRWRPSCSRSTAKPSSTRACSAF